MFYDVVIVGGGPAGLACAHDLAQAGCTTLLVERRDGIGKKVCAGGITWNGLIQKYPDAPIEKSFPQQLIKSSRQRIRITSPTPIIATVNRIKLGELMFEKARRAGADIRVGCQVIGIEDSSVRIRYTNSGRLEKCRFGYLVGADGCSSIVRRSLGLPVEHFGIGINFQLPEGCDQMEWHLDHTLFGNGYGWIFPHRHTVSIGAYIDSRMMAGRQLLRNLIGFGRQRGFALYNEKARAERINYDFRGYRFGNIFLAGEAAGLASGLTGEGMYPAIVSGENIAREILGSTGPGEQFQRLLRNHRHHRLVLKISGQHRLFGILLTELTLLLLRCRILGFEQAEMAFHKGLAKR